MAGKILSHIIQLRNCIVFSLLLFSSILQAQQDSSINNPGHLYHPQRDIRPERVLQDTIKKQLIPDSLSAEDLMQIHDSLFLREQFIQDSLLARQLFVQDSIQKREIFVRDSIMKRQRILDSLNYLKNELPKLVNAALYSLSDEFIIFSNDISIIGDSMLSRYIYMRMPFSFNKPFMPWRSEIDFTGGSIAIDIDTNKKLIKSIRGKDLDWFFDYNENSKIIRLNTRGMFTKKYDVNYYKQPIDSVFFDSDGRVVKIKRYLDFYAADDRYQKGKHLFLFLHKIKQFQYDNAGNISHVQYVDFCDRWRESDPSKICLITDYSFSRDGTNILLTRKNDPANKFSDGNFIYDFNNYHVLNSVTFNNVAGTEKWKTIIEYNQLGNVTRYVYQVNDRINKTLVINYYLDDPNAKYKAELITCIFENDGISYFQENNTTGKSRSRDHFTGEWGPWE
ncbi:MAG: hypothetical protein JXP36_06055 [Bacteroidales bacterium]|nr:hypothetical protein [Bacteroidales bacterium]